MRRSQDKMVGCRTSTRWLVVASLAACLALTGCGTASKWKGNDDRSPAAKSARVGQLEVGWDLLQSTLSGEAKLEWLLLFKKFTLKDPGKRIEQMLRKIQEASAKRVAELAELRRLSPDVSAAPPPSAIGDAIQQAATEKGTKELVFSDGSFNIRFVFLQAQATRMISVIAKQTALMDPNPRRQKWLGEVSKQYEGFRNEFVEAFESCKPR